MAVVFRLKGSALALPLLFAGLSASAASISAPALQEAKPAPMLLAQNSEANAELFFTVEQLKQEVLELRGMVEELQHKVSVMQKQGRERYIDIDRRIQDLSVPGSNAGAPTASTTPVTQPVAESAPVAPTIAVPISAPSPEESEAYQKAYGLIKDKQFDAAIDALHGFIGTYPEGDLTANAYYWLGEVYLVAPKLEQAKAAFTVVINKFPQHRKAADALYKLGVVYKKLGRESEAKAYLDQVISEYPNSSAARLAAELR